jgi:hypothetical protein
MVNFSDVSFMPLKEEDYELPSYEEESYLLVEVAHNSESKFSRFEVLEYAYDGGACFWIQEDIGFEYFLDMHFDFDELPEGWNVIEGITSKYIRGDGWMTDDDVEYNWKRIRPATQEEIDTLSVEALSDGKEKKENC